MTIFWSVLAILYLVLSWFTWKARKDLRNELGKPGDMLGSGYTNKEIGKIAMPTPSIYKALLNMFFVDIIGFVFAATAAVITIFM